MTPLNAWFEVALVLFGIAYVVLAVVRIRLAYKNLDAHAGFKGNAAERIERSSSNVSGMAKRAEEFQQRAQEQQDQLFRQAQETQERWSAVLTRLEALVDKIEKGSGA